jgi:hypothetical protein
VAYTLHEIAEIADGGYARSRDVPIIEEQRLLPAVHSVAIANLKKIPWNYLYFPNPSRCIGVFIDTRCEKKFISATAWPI